MNEWTCFIIVIGASHTGIPNSNVNTWVHGSSPDGDTRDARRAPSWARAQCADADTPRKYPAQTGSSGGAAA